MPWRSCQIQLLFRDGRYLFLLYVLAWWLPRFFLRWWNVTGVLLYETPASEFFSIRKLACEDFSPAFCAVNRRLFWISIIIERRFSTRLQPAIFSLKERKFWNSLGEQHWCVTKKSSYRQNFRALTTFWKKMLSLTVVISGTGSGGVPITFNFKWIC